MTASKKPLKTLDEMKIVSSPIFESLDSSLEKSFLKILNFCLMNKDFAVKIPKVTSLSERWVEIKAKQFVNSRITAAPQLTKLYTDPLLENLLCSYFNVNTKSVNDAIIKHKQSMAAENAIGTLLEEYLALKLEPQGWIWCAGQVLKAIDFIKFEPKGKVTLLQVKNRSNSENSSSSAIRKGTPILKWTRMNAATGDTLWEKFPDESSKMLLSESDFQAFVDNKIHGWKA